MTIQPIFANEPIRYTGVRHTWNNGFRRRWLANGARHASVINAARQGDLETVLSVVKDMGGVRAPLGIARSIIKAAQKLPTDVPGHRIERSGRGMMVFTPAVSWRWKNNRQVGVIEWVPMFGTRGF